MVVKLGLTLREEHRFRLSRINYLRRYLGLRVMKLQENGESYIMLSYMHCILSLNINRNLKSKQMKWAGYVAHMEQSRNANRILVGKPEEK